MRILVVGAGVIGVTSAWALWRAGHEVTVVEARAGAGLETSFANGALLHPSSIQPWPAPGLPRKLLGWLNKEDAPFLVRLQALPPIAGWGLAFLGHCTAAHYRSSLRFNLTLALETLAAMAEIRAATGIAYDANPGAAIKVFENPESLDAATAEAASLADLGLVTERLDPAAAVAREPALAALEVPFAGALHMAQDEVGDCHLFTVGLAAWLAERGVAFRFATAIERLTADGGRVTGLLAHGEHLAADAVVLAAGINSPALARPLGVRLPIAPVRGLSLTTPRRAWNGAPANALIFEDGKFVLTPVGDRLRVAGTAEIAGFDPTPQPQRAAAVLAGVIRRLPGFRACAEHPDRVLWGGLRPVAATGRPIIGPTRVAGLFVNGGHGHMGWTLAAGSAARLADAIGRTT